MYQRVKIQVCHEGVWAHGDTALPILNLCTRWMYGVIFMPWLFRPWWKRTQYSLTMNIKTVWAYLGCILFTNIQLHVDILIKLALLSDWSTEPCHWYAKRAKCFCTHHDQCLHKCLRPPHAIDMGYGLEWVTFVSFMSQLHTPFRSLTHFVTVYFISDKSQFIWICCIYI